MHRTARQQFRGVRSRRKSQFGWVWETSPFTWSDFAEQHLRAAAEADLEATRHMLRAVQRADVGHAFAAHFYWRVFPHRQHVLTVHRVIIADDAP